MKKCNLKNIVEKYYLIFLVGIISSLYFSTVVCEIRSYGGDSASYILLAKSLIKGKGYIDLYHPEELPHTQFPFFFPFILAITMLFSGESYCSLYIPVILSAIITNILIIYIASKYLPSFWLVIYMLWSATIPFSVWWLREIASEWPYMALSFATLAYASLICSKDKLDKKRLYLTFFLALLAYFTRRIGITLIFSLFFSLYLASSEFRKFKTLFPIILLTFIPIFGWALRDIFSGGKILGYNFSSVIQSDIFGETYNMEFLEFLKRIAGSIIILIKKIPFLIFHGVSNYKILFLIWGGLVWLGIVVGYFKSIRIKRMWPILIYLLFYLSTLLSWPWFALELEEERFLMPILPLTNLLFLLGILSLLKNAKIFKYIFSILLIFILLINISTVINLIIKDYQGNFFTPQVANFIKMNKMIKELPGNHIVISRKPSVTALLSSAKSISFLYTKDTNALLETIKKYNVDLILVDEFSEETINYLVPSIKANSEYFEIINKIGYTYLLYVKKYPALAPRFR